MDVKTIGLIGGLSWHSSAEYYRIINEETQKKYGDANSAKIILNSVNFQEFVELQQKERWDAIESKILKAGEALVSAGADLLAFGANTTHRFADVFEQKIPRPLVHIADATAKSILSKGIKKVGLLGTKLTMQMDFYKDRLARHGVEAVVPGEPEIELVHSIIFSELVRGVITPESRDKLFKVSDSLSKQGAEGIILGCTELPLIMKPEDSALPLFDTTRLHAEAIVKAAD